MSPRQVAVNTTGSEWIERFHDGERRTLSACYEDHFAIVERSVGRFVSGADRETVIHEVFLRLLQDRALRQHFSGGSFAAWLTTIAKNHSIDWLRRHSRETSLAPEVAARLADEQGDSSRTEARLLVDQFKRRLSPDEVLLFERRFLEQLSQREAAKELSLHRTTLVYREMKLRRRLRAFLLGEDRK